MAIEGNSGNSNPNYSGERRPNSQGLVLALELMELGIELARQRIARQNPGISHGELVVKTNKWLSAPRGEARSSNPL
jgi:hypothetical protein